MLTDRSSIMKTTKTTLTLVALQPLYVKMKTLKTLKTAMKISKVEAILEIVLPVARKCVDGVSMQLILTTKTYKGTQENHSIFFHVSPLAFVDQSIPLCDRLWRDETVTRCNQDTDFYTWLENAESVGSQRRYAKKEFK